jgi:hypothetical protein
LFFLADEEVDEKTFADLFLAQEGDDVEVGVVVIEGQVVLEILVELQEVR